MTTTSSATCVSMRHYTRTHAHTHTHTHTHTQTHTHTHKHTRTSSLNPKQGAKECPRCLQPAQTSKIRTQRVVNNMADKLAKRVLKPPDMHARQQKIEASKNLRLTRAKEAQEALVSNTNASTSTSKSEGLWLRITGAAQLGSACSVLRHRTAGAVVEMFHVNGWFRFRYGLHPHMTCMYPPPHMTCMYPPPIYSADTMGGSAAGATDKQAPSGVTRAVS